MELTRTELPNGKIKLVNEYGKIRHTLSGKEYTSVICKPEAVAQYEAVSGVAGVVRSIPTDTSARDNAERNIVGYIISVAQRHNALPELAAMSDVNIPALQQLMEAKDIMGVEKSQIESDVLVLVHHLEAITGGTWETTWNGLKSRFQRYVVEFF